MSEGLESAQPAGLHRIAVGADTVRMFLAARALLGTAYGSTDEQMIAEDMLVGHMLQVTLRQDDAGWALTVWTNPGLRAWVIFTTSQRSWRQAFDAQGMVSFVGLEEVWLRTGFDLIVELVP
jgi:hypothetical protein